MNVVRVIDLWPGRVQAAFQADLEVVMGRGPEVFVRRVSMAEGQRLQRIGRTAKDPVRLRRAIVGADVSSGAECAGYRCM
jgi:hypothetical protein